MTAVIAWLWQGLLLVAVIDGLLRAMPRLNAATRHVIWCGALGGIVLLAAVHAAGSNVAIAATAAPPEVVSGAPLVRLPEAPGWLVAAAIGAWLVLALLRLAGVARGLTHVARLRTSARPLDGDRPARLVTWLAMRERGRSTELRVTDLLSGPAPSVSSARSSSCHASCSTRSTTRCSNRS